MISFTGDFRQDFDRVLSATAPFALVRFGDGEHAILTGKTYHAKSDGWTAPGGSWLAPLLRLALEHAEPGYCVGLPAPCCLSRVGYSLRKYVRAAPDHVTHSMLFGNANYARIGELVERFKEACFVSHGPRATIQIPRDGVSQPWDLDAIVRAMQAERRPILLAAGPSAKIIAHRYWTRTPPADRQICLDVGAALNVRLHDRGGRAYHKDGKHARHACSFSAPPSWTHTPGGRRSRLPPLPLASPIKPAPKKGRPMPATIAATRKPTPRPVVLSSSSSRSTRPKPVPLTTHAKTATTQITGGGAPVLALPNTAPSKGSNKRGCLSCMKRRRK